MKRQVKFLKWQPRNFSNEFTVFILDNPSTESELKNILQKKAGFIEEITKTEAIEDGVHHPLWELKMSGQWNGGFPFLKVSVAELEKIKKSGQSQIIKLGIELTEDYLKKVKLEEDVLDGKYDSW